MSSIIRRMQEINKEPQNETAYLYQAMMADIKAKAYSDARMIVQGEVENIKSQLTAALSKIELAENERESAMKLKEMSDDKMSEQANEITMLKQAVQEANRKLEMTLESIDNKTQIIKNDLAKERQTVRKLENEISRLTGRLSEAQKTQNLPAPIIKNQPIPEFNAVPVRDVNGRIMSVTITPSGTH